MVMGSVAVGGFRVIECGQALTIYFISHPATVEGYMSSLQHSPSSTSLNPSDSTQQPSRKRQRSRSMQSDTSSSSPKRAMSEGVSHESVRSPNPDQMSHLTLADTTQDIDAYMAEQGEAEIPQTLSVTPPADSATWETMPASEKWSWVKEEKQKSLKEGETWYLVAQEWWKRWARACGGLVDKQDPVPENELGPVDNSPLFDPSGRLKPGVTEGVDHELVPSEVWIRFIKWYFSPWVYSTAFTNDMFIGMELLHNPCHAALSTEAFLAP
jgi:ubiquitin carboxyl-terminal hydrolase 4/11